MKSKTTIKKQTKRKSYAALVETINLARKTPAWTKVAAFLSGPSSRYVEVNLKELDEKTSEGDTVVVLGKVLGVGDFSKRVRVCALGFSSSAKDKLKKAKSECIDIAEEIKKNPKLQGVKIIS
ncbi:MAG: 50S ribosomal protein L18e [Nanoarchaeota archaeon]